MHPNIKRAIADVLDQHRPHSPSNKDAALFDYKFWTELESHAKKMRASALEKALEHKNERDEGILVAGSMFRLNLVVSAAPETFSKELFMDNIREKFPQVPAHALRELATASVAKGTPRKSYKIEEND